MRMLQAGILLPEQCMLCCLQRLPSCPRLEFEGRFVIERRLVSAVLMLVFLPPGGAGGAMKAGRLGPNRAASVSQLLTETGKTQLNAILDAADLADLRWSAFGTYRNDVRKFYNAFNGSLPWTRESRPGSQAIAIIQLLKDAENEGLNPEDYDGPRWDGRISALQQSSPAPESELVRFDVALTVSAMRYISDLHLGRANPRRFHFELDIDHTNFDLSEFLQQQVVNASDVGSTIATVEPPFPAYQRTLNALRTYVDLARRDDGDPLPVPRKAIKPGDAYPGLPRLVRLLVLLQDLPEKEKDVSSSTLYQGALVAGGDALPAAPRTGGKWSDRRTNPQRPQHSPQSPGSSIPTHPGTTTLVAASVSTTADHSKYPRISSARG